MYASFGEFFAALKEARFGFGAFWQWVTDLYYSMTANPDIAKVWDGLMNLIQPIYAAVPYILILLSLIVAFFGKKVMPVLKFVFFFVIGFALGVHFITPLLGRVVTVPGWVCGLVIAVVSAVVYRFLYMASYAIACLYSVYILFYSGFYISPVIEHTTARALFCLGIAAVAVILAFMLRKYLEMLGTAMLGGYLVAVIFRGFIFDYRQLSFLAATPKVGAFLIAFLIGIPAALFQYKKRRKYR